MTRSPPRCRVVLVVPALTGLPTKRFNARFIDSELILLPKNRFSRSSGGAHEAKSRSRCLGLARARPRLPLGQLRLPDAGRPLRRGAPRYGNYWGGFWGQYNKILKKVINMFMVGVWPTLRAVLENLAFLVPFSPALGANFLRFSDLLRVWMTLCCLLRFWETRVRYGAWRAI